jgi:hypothetical protein
MAMLTPWPVQSPTNDAQALAQLPLHTGAAPAYLFQRMWRLAGAITMAVVDEYGSQEMLRRLSDPVVVPGVRLRAWFRLAFVRRHHRHLRRDEGSIQTFRQRPRYHVAGGKGGTSRKTPGGDRRGGGSMRDHVG